MVVGAPDRQAGSSPHTRGAPLAQNLRNAYKRIIPAYAGSTGSPASTPGTARDHPRIRGEHVVAENDSGLPGGSSPHTRGALGRGG